MRPVSCAGCQALQRRLRALQSEGAETFTWPDGGTTPFRGEKNTNWEGDYRVPCLLRWPGVVKPGTEINDVLSHEDWLPTFMAAAGEPDIKDKLLKGYKAGDKTFKVHLDGYDQRDVFAGKANSAPAKSALSRQPSSRGACGPPPAYWPFTLARPPGRSAASRGSGPVNVQVARPRRSSRTSIVVSPSRVSSTTRPEKCPARPGGASTGSVGRAGPGQL
jgi:hypothetical protein